MRLSKVLIKNFRAIKEIEFTMPSPKGDIPGSGDFVTLIGPNNIGKSSVLEAMRLACPDNSLSTPSERHFPSFETNDCSMEVEFHLSEINEKDRENPLIARCETEGQIKVRQSWTKNGNEKSKHSHETCAHSYDFTDEISPLGNPEFKSHEAIAPLIAEYESRKNKALGSLTDNRKNDLLKIAIELKADCIQKSATAEWGNHVGLASITKAFFVPKLIYVPAIREVSKEADTKAAKSSTKQIVDLLFNNYLSKQKEIVSFQNAVQEVKNLFTRTGTNEAISLYESQMKIALQQLIDLEPVLDFEAPDITSNLTASTNLLLKKGSLETFPEEQGHGAQRAIIIMLLQILERVEAAKEEEFENRPLVILIEEPEIYLHPQMILKMRDTLLSLAKKSHISVICTSHSPFFINLADRHEGILVCRSEENELKIFQRSEDLYGDDSEDRERMRMLLDFDPSVNSAFFTERVTLVEGDTEASAIPALAEKLAECGLNRERCKHALSDTTIVNCSGKPTIYAFQKVLNAFKIPYRVVHDADIRDSFSDSTNKSQNTINDKILELLSGIEDNRRLHSPTFEPEMFENQGEVKGNKAFNTWQKIRKMNLNDLKPEYLEKWKQFFAFCVHDDIENLKKTLPTSEDLIGFSLEGLVSEQEVTRRKDRRDEIDNIELEEGNIAGINYLELAAGTSRIPTLDDHSFIYADNKLIGKIVGDSMSDTLKIDDKVLLDVTDFKLEPFNQETNQDGISYDDFNNQIKSGEIYLLAINDDIERAEYTLKRVRTVPVPHNDSFLLFIEADNPDTNWGERGKFFVREYDRVHFAAKLCGIIKIVETETD